MRMLGSANAIRLEAELEERRAGVEVEKRGQRSKDCGLG